MCFLSLYLSTCCQVQCHESFSLFSFRSFMLLAFTFRLDQFSVNFYYMVWLRVQLHSSACGNPVILVPFVEVASFGILVESQWAIDVWVYYRYSQYYPIGLNIYLYVSTAVLITFILARTSVQFESKVVREDILVCTWS